MRPHSLSNYLMNKALRYLEIGRNVFRRMAKRSLSVANAAHGGLVQFGSAVFSAPTPAINPEGGMAALADHVPHVVRVSANE
jgi:hypothetical protein